MQSTPTTTPRCENVRFTFCSVPSILCDCGEHLGTCFSSSVRRRDNVSGLWEAALTWAKCPIHNRGLVNAIPAPPSDVVWGSENGRYQGVVAPRLAEAPSSLPVGSPQPTGEDWKLYFACKK